MAFICLYYCKSLYDQWEVFSNWFFCLCVLLVMRRDREYRMTCRCYVGTFIYYDLLLNILLNFILHRMSSHRRHRYFLLCCFNMKQDNCDFCFGFIFRLLIGNLLVLLYLIRLKDWIFSNFMTVNFSYHTSFYTILNVGLIFIVQMF